MTEGLQKKKRSLVQKLFLNEQGEVSFRKTGTIFAAIGGTLVAGPVAGAAYGSAGTILTAIGAMFIALGQFEKNDRK